jgi:hypothetical protein
MSHLSEPVRRNSTGNFNANRNSTALMMLLERPEENRPKVLCRG